MMTAMRAQHGLELEALCVRFSVAIQFLTVISFGACSSHSRSEPQFWENWMRQEASRKMTGNQHDYFLSGADLGILARLGA